MEKVISFLTDIEGSISYMSRWAALSPYIKWDNNRLSFKNTGPQTQPLFVYGGDCTDKGPGDLRIMSALVHFKQSNPDKVYLIAGNRDIKSRRFTYELDPQHIRQRLLFGRPAFWDKRNVSPKSYVEQYIQQEKLTQTPEEAVKKMSIEQCQTIYLKWMLFETMGCGSSHGKPDTFEHRRTELAECNGYGVERELISDEEVTQSFIRSVAPQGLMTQYLQQAQLGFIEGETLFIHGAITPENMGYIPGLPEDARISDAKEWINGLNDWFQSQIDEWSMQPVESTIQEPGGRLLDRYVIYNPKSIVTTNWYRHGRLAPIAPEVVSYLNKAGIYRVVTGHQPFSDFPLIIRNPSLEVIVGDTGYSDPNAFTDNRGKAHHMLEISGEGKHSYASIEAILKDGSMVKLVLPNREEVARVNDVEIGHFTANGELIRPSSSGLVSSQLDGFEIHDKPYDATARLII